MSGTWQLERKRPLVALVWSLPVVAAALEEALDFADVRVFDAANGETLDLFRQLRPDAIVVESSAAAEAAEAYAGGSGLPVLYLSPQERLLRLLGPAGWTDIESGGDPGPGAVRNALAGALFAGAGEA